MSKLILNPEYELYERKGKPFCSSLQVAVTFLKRHDNVLRDIEELDCSENFNLLNFEEINYKDDRGRKQPQIIMTKDGFAFLVMGYRGKRAAAFKETYINRFNQMESFITSLYAAKLEHPSFTEAVMLAHDEPKHYHFINETDMINRIVLGVPAKDVREVHGLAKGESIRPYLTGEQIADVRALQMADIGLLAVIDDFHMRRRALQEIHERRKTPRLAA